MVRILPSFGQWALAIRDFETPYGRIGPRQETLLYELRTGALGETPVSPSWLAGHYGVQPSVITQVLARLEAGGFIQRQPNPEDGRASTIHITDAGVTISEHVEGMFVQSLLDSMESVDDGQLDMLRTSMEILARIATDLHVKHRHARNA